MKSSYQRLKDRIAELKEENSALYAEIRVMIRFPNSAQAALLKARYNIQYELEAMAWAGKVPMVTSEGSTTVKVK